MYPIYMYIYPMHMYVYVYVSYVYVYVSVYPQTLSSLTTNISKSHEVYLSEFSWAYFGFQKLAKLSLCNETIPGNTPNLNESIMKYGRVSTEMFENTSLRVKSGLGQTLSCVKLTDDGQPTDERLSPRIIAVEIRDNR